MKQASIYCIKILVAVFLLSPAIIIITMQFSSEVFEALVFWYRRIAATSAVPILYTTGMLWLCTILLNQTRINTILKKVIISFIAVPATIYSVKIFFTFPLTNTLTKFTTGYIIATLVSVWFFELNTTRKATAYKEAGV